MLTQTMSKRSQTQKKQQSNPFCAICKNAGMPTELYTNHFTKSEPGPRGVVVCPTILSAECTYCHRIGHFKSACPIFTKASKEAQIKAKTVARQLAREQWKTNNAIKPVVVTKKNAFALLNNDSEEDDTELKPVSNTKTWATIVCQDPPAAVVDPAVVDPAVVDPAVVDPLHKPSTKRVFTPYIRWAEMESDSEEEDAEDEDRMQMR